jgi:hypothetical protein
MNHRVLLLAPFALAWSIAFSQTQQSVTATESMPEMRRIYVEDQRDRGVLPTDTGEATKPSDNAKPPPQLDDEILRRRDFDRQRRVREMLAKGQLKTAQDFHDAAFIFQHSQEPKDYLLAHVLVVEAVIKGDDSSKWISAATLDRYLQAIGQPQVFGTQYLDKDYLFFLSHKTDDAAIKAHKPERGKTQDPYDRSILADSVRLAFCVPGTEQQKKNLADFDAGRYPEGILPPGCTR